MWGANVKYFGRQIHHTLFAKISGKKSAMLLAVFDFSCSLAPPHNGKIGAKGCKRGAGK